MQSYVDIIIVGAGVAGLTCASKLIEKGYKVTVLEAANYIGGRVKQAEGFVSWSKVDLGAEIIHGNAHELFKICQAEKWNTRRVFTWAHGDGGPDPEEPVGGGIGYYYFGKEKRFIKYNAIDSDFAHLNELLDELRKMKLDPNDRRSLKDYLIENGVNERMLALAEASYANTLCNTLESLSLHETCRLEYNWGITDGEGDYRLDGSMGLLIQYFSRNVKDIRTNWIVKFIDYSKTLIQVYGEHGEILYAPKVVITVPLPILKDGDILFEPPLPRHKFDALQKLQMNRAIKICIKFGNRFWPRDTHGVLCANCIIPEIWFDSQNRNGQIIIQSDKSQNGEPPPKESSTWTAACFTTAKYADYIASLTKHEIVNKILDQLNEMYGSNLNPYPATIAFLDCIIQDWGLSPYIRGGYSTPSIGTSQRTRVDLASSVNNKLFFAGEATNTGAYMALFGAIETGNRAAQEIERSMKKQQVAKL